MNLHTQMTALRVTTLQHYITIMHRAVGASSAESELYQFDIGGATDGFDPNRSRLYRKTFGAYTRLAGGYVPPSFGLGTPNRLTFSSIGTDESGWIDGVLAAQAVDGVAQNQVAGYLQLDFGEVGGAGTMFVDDLMVCTSRIVTATGMPAGWKLRAAGVTGAGAAGGSATVDLGGALLPVPLLEVLDPTGNVIDSIATVYGGDTYRFALDVMPAVSGNLKLDINAEQQPSRVDGTAIVPFDSSTYNRAGAAVVGVPTWRAGAFPLNNRAAVRTAKAASGFSFSRPVEDDWTIYAVVKNVDGNSTGGGQWYQASAFIDAEQGGIGPDYGLNVRIDGRLIAGTGGDVSAIGTHPINDGLVHVIAWKRTKATGRVQVWVDGVADIDFVNNASTLNYNALLYFGYSPSVGQAGVDYGRVLAYDAAHSDAERLLITNALSALYLLAPPDKPVVAVQSIAAALRLTGSAYNSASMGADPHAASQWQIALATDPAFAVPVFDSGFDAAHLLAIDSPPLIIGTFYIARVRYRSTALLVSPWSDTSAATRLGTWAQTDLGPDVLSLPVLQVLNFGRGPDAGKLDNVLYHNVTETLGDLTITWPNYVLGAIGSPGWQGVIGTGGDSADPQSMIFSKPVKKVSLWWEELNYYDGFMAAYDALGVEIARYTMDYHHVVELGLGNVTTIEFPDNRIYKVTMQPNADWVTYSHIVIERYADLLAVGGWEQTDAAPDAAWAGTDAAPATVWT
jgi:hypothetical protein